MFNTPVLFIVFNRIENAQIVFNEIKIQKPAQLYVFADGPRADHPEDKHRCEQTRAIILNQIDWDCNLKTLFLDFNLGCGKGPAKAITWFFENVTDGIIIEDDCVPHPDFFNYCAELLEKYRNDTRIMVIGATTYRDDYPCKESYAFSIYPTMAAWATWKRVWQKYDYYLSSFTREELENKLKEYFFSSFEFKNWMNLYDWIIAEKFDSFWDWQLNYMMYMNDGIAIRPQKNMIKNIGFGNDATHTSYLKSPNFTANREIFSCLPLKHPSAVKINKQIDSKYYIKMHKISIIRQAVIKIKNRIRKMYLIL
jgi:hypothetical protein